MILIVLNWFRDAKLQTTPGTAGIHFRGIFSQNAVWNFVFLLHGLCMASLCLLWPINQTSEYQPYHTLTFRNPSEVCWRSFYGISSTDLTPPEKIYSSTQKSIYSCTKKILLFAPPTTHARVVSSSCDGYFFDLHCCVSVRFSLMYSLYFSNSKVFDLMSLPAHHSMNGMSPKS